MHRSPENGAERCGAGRSGAGRDGEGLGHHSPSWPPGGPSAAWVAVGEPAGGARRKLSVETIIATTTLLAVSHSFPDPVRPSVRLETKKGVRTTGNRGRKEEGKERALQRK